MTDQLATEVVLIRQIARRALDTIPALRTARVLSIDIQADLAACHYRGCPLRLDALLHTDDLSFARDVLGIRRAIDRRTGELAGGFQPRFHANAARPRFWPVVKDRTFAARKRAQRERDRLGAAGNAAAGALAQGA